MVTLAFDVSDVDQEDAVKVYAPPPPPGMYRAKIRDCKLGNKMEDGKAVPGGQRVEVTYETNDKRHKGGWVYDYLPTENDDEYVRKRLTAFFLATGVIKAGQKSGKFDPAKVIGNELIIRVKADSYKGNYRAKIGGVWAANNSAITEDMLGPSQAERPSGNGESGEYEPPEAGAFDTTEETPTEAEDDGVAKLREACEAADNGDDDAAEELLKFFNEEINDPAYDPNEFSLWTEWFDKLVEDEIIEVPEVENSEDDSDAEDRPYSEWSLEELREELNNRGQKTSGTKSQLVKRLEETEEPF